MNRPARAVCGPGEYVKLGFDLGAEVMTDGNLAEYTVSELSGAVKKSIEEGFGHVRVRGELGRVSRPASGHVYLDLKDEKAVLASVIWKVSPAS